MSKSTIRADKILDPIKKNVYFDPNTGFIFELTGGSSICWLPTRLLAGSVTDWMVLGRLAGSVTDWVVMGRLAGSVTDWMVLGRLACV